MKAWRTMTRMTIILRTTSDEDDDFDFRENDHGTAMPVADRSVETVSDSPDEELGKANTIS